MGKAGKLREKSSSNDMLMAYLNNQPKHETLCHDTVLHWDSSFPWKMLDVEVRAPFNLLIDYQ